VKAEDHTLLEKEKDSQKMSKAAKAAGSDRKGAAEEKETKMQLDEAANGNGRGARKQKAENKVVMKETMKVETEAEVQVQQDENRCDSVQEAATSKQRRKETSREVTREEAPKKSHEERARTCAPDVTVGVVGDEAVRASETHDRRAYAPSLALFVCILSGGGGRVPGHPWKRPPRRGPTSPQRHVCAKAGRTPASASSVRAASSCVDQTSSAAPNSRPELQ